MMTCSDAEDNMLQARQLHKQNQVPIQFPRDKRNINLIKAPTCMSCSLEEVVMRSAIDHPRKKARQHSRRLGHLSMCNDPNFNVISHSCCPIESRMNRLHYSKVCHALKLHTMMTAKIFLLRLEEKAKIYPYRHNGNLKYQSYGCRTLYCLLGGIYNRGNAL